MPGFRFSKAQVKMFETIAVLVVFFFLLIFGASFYFVLQKSSIEKEAIKTIQLRSIQTTQKVSYLPELDCTQVGIQVENCFDAIKLKKFSDMLNDEETGERIRLDYFNVFGYSTVNVRSIFPVEQEFLLYNKTMEDYTTMYKNNLPLTIFNPILNTYSFGVVEVTVYEK
jgi:hypothetical protein